ncbi:MAG: hypothetical protein ACU84Q_01475 [Gammaproteobacteria bacterium]
MNWDAIGAVGEIVGASAVVVSLIYLALQIRQNSRIVAANTVQSISASGADAAWRIAENPHLAGLVVKLIERSGSFTREENVQLRAMMRAVFRNFENYYYQYQRGHVEAEIWVGYERTVIDQLSIPEVSKWWNHHHNVFGDHFVKFINDILSSMPQTQSSWAAGLADKGESTSSKAMDINS